MDWIKRISDPLLCEDLENVLREIRRSDLLAWECLRARCVSVPQRQASARLARDRQAPKGGRAAAIVGMFDRAVCLGVFVVKRGPWGMLRKPSGTKNRRRLISTTGEIVRFFSTAARMN